jgi:hypothetical protein
MSRFVVTYQGNNDPSKQEERSLVSALKRVTVVDKMPGTVLVEGDESDVASAVRQLSNWTFSLERGLSAAPPHRRVKPAAV